MNISQQNLKYTQPNECRICSLVTDSLSKKVLEIKMGTGIWKYIAPEHGSEA